MSTRMQQRRGTAAQWISTNSGNGPILAAGEIGFESDNDRFKIGDGVNHWVDLPYFANNEALTNLIDGAPDILNTLGELAEAIGNDPDFFTDVNTAIINLNSTISSHALDTTGVHGIANTADLATQDYVDEAVNNSAVDQASLAGVGIDWNAGTDQFDIDSTVATKTYADVAVSTHSSDTTNVHGIVDTSALATKVYADNAVSTHSSDVTNVHGIEDMTEIATKAFTASLLTGSTKSNISITGDKNGLTITAENGVADSNTDQLTEGSNNLYFTTERAQDAIGNSVGTGLSYNDATGAVSVDTALIQARVADVSDVEIGYLNGVTAGLQTQLDAKAPSASPTFTGTVSGITKSMVGLGSVDNTADSAKPVSTAQAQAIATAKSEAIADATSQVNAVIAAAPAALNTLDELAAALGDDANFASTITTSLAAKAPLASPTFTGTVAGITKSMVGLGNVDNTTDAAKPISTATQTALDAKLASATAATTYAPIASPTFTGTVAGITKSMVGLGNVDNTTDAAKPVSTATQTALNLKANTSDISELAQDAVNTAIIAGTGIDKAYDDVANTITLDIDSTVATLTGTQTLTNKTLTSPVINTPTGITKSDVGLANVNNTTDAAKPVSTATQTALDLKAPLASPTFTGTVTLPTGTVTSGMILDGTIVAGDLADGAVTSAKILDNTIVNGDINASAAIDWTKLAISSTVSATEIGYVDGVTSSIQTQLGAKAPLASPELTGTPTAPTAAANTNTTQIATTAYVQTEIADLIASAPGALDTLDELAAALGDDANYAATITTALATKAPLASPTFTGTVSGITKSMVGLGSVDNTTDAAKPVSTATQTALDTKLSSATAASTYAPLASPTFTGTVSGVTKAHVGLGSVDNTSDSAKPISTATQTALDAKLASATAASTYAPIASPTFTGTVSGVTKSMVGLGSVDNTADTAKPVSTAQQTALNLKAPLASPTFTGTVAGITKSMVGLGSVDNTADTAKPVSTATQTALDAKLALSGGTMTGALTLSADPSASLHAATKQYVDNTASGVVAKPQVLGATTANIDATYSNGTAGVGATLTNNTNGVFPSAAGGASGWAVGKGILVKNQTNKAHNGRYFISNMGSVSTPYVLTRCTYCDEASEIPGAYIFVQDGTFAGTGWIQVVADPATFVVGTDNIDVFQFSGSGTITAGTGITVSGNEVSISTGAITSSLILDGTIVDGDINASAAIAQSKISGLSTSLSEKAPLASPTFTGTVAGITKSMVGLGNVDNTTDAGKPISTATQTALDLKAPLASPTFTGTVAGITKSMVGLGNVDNTTDAAKPISTATQTALDLKLATSTAASTYAPIASPTFTGTVAGITKSMVGLGSVDNTTDAAKPVSTATQTALDLKANLASPTFTGTPIAPLAATGTNTTQLATTSFVQQELNILTSGAPAALNTLDELAAALGDDANYAATITTALAAKAPLASPTFTGTVTLPTGTVTSGMIADGTIVNGDISASAAIALSKLANGTSGQIIVANASGVPTWVSETGDITISDTGATAISAGVIVDGDINASAAIAQSKISGLTTDLAAKAPLASPTFTGTVAGITKSMVGLANVDNTADSAKPVSTATQTALDLKANLASPTLTGTPISTTPIADTNTTQIATTAYVVGQASSTTPVMNGSAAVGTSLKYARADHVHATDTSRAPLASPTFTGTVAGITKSMVGLGSVDNTADTAKPVSTAQQTALDLKANLASPTFTGTVTLPTGTVTSGMILDGTIVDGDISATAAIAQSKIDGLGTSLGLKANLASPALSGTPTAPTATAGTNTTQIATTAYADAAVAALVASAPAALNTLNELATALGNDAAFSTTVTNSLAAKAPIASPTFTGTATIPTLSLTNALSVANGGTGITSFGTGVATFLGTPSSANFASMITDEIGTGNIVLSEVATNSQTASYTLVLADRGKVVEMNVGSANNLTVPLDASVNFPVGTQIDILQVGSGQTTIVATGGVTINGTPGLKLRTQWAGATLRKRAANTWVLVGDLTA